ncbi:hypothetical protein C2G38_2153149 [Gigaspora rosea]|uniref:Uncharacterized protein n=1 Tax=Gigaspora rosea TaxID=44941 RepID=A0A397W6B0_9GLOM|nr:hypothetical protein C2G38_2153149 [Gigaspora rosea]
MSFLFIAFCFIKNVTGDYVLAPKDLSNSSPLLTYTATVNPTNNTKVNLEFELDINLDSIEEKYATMTLQISQKKLKINQCELLNNKHLKYKSKIPLHATRIENKDNTLISNNDFTELLYIQLQNIIFNTKSKYAWKHHSPKNSL